MLPDGSVTSQHRPAALLCGSFNPLHDGHRGLAEIASAKLACEVGYELSLVNVDKPELTADVTAERVAQFRDHRAVWVTREPTFLGKARLFPEVAFVVGADTATRLIDPRYHDGDDKRRDAALEEMRALGCRFVVAGRMSRGSYVSAAESLGDFAAEMFEPISEAEFRMDVSSTQLRATSSPPEKPATS